MNKAEYWILRRALKHEESLRDVAYECGLALAEVAVAANRLFQNGDILARVIDGDKDLENSPNVVLTMSEIQAYLDGKLRASYALTSQGGARWEAIAQAEWNRYFVWYCNDSKVVKGELFECELIGSERQLIEEIIRIDCYLPGHSIHIQETEIWEVLEPWQPTYWKTLPKAYRVCYQARDRVPHICKETPPDLFEAYKQAEKWYLEIQQWYTDPKFEDELSSPNNYTVTNTNYYAPTPETSSERAKYLILDYAVMRDRDFGDFGIVALDCNLSHTETLTAANSLFQNGDILAQMYCEGTQVSDVVMTIPEIQANLDGKLQVYYYLTAQGGRRWEVMVQPNWYQYYRYVCKDYKPDKIPEYEIEITSYSQQLIEKLLSVSSYVFSEIPIPGTESWDEIEPWQATYWKTLPLAYKVCYRARQNNYFINANTSPEWEAARSQAYEWFSGIQQWYTEPQFE
ncbi:MAG TPA: hypothetical protein DDZ80_27840 [Cyanobacteria bacterium UBA8803]|nr:hypothetical protein [Cyanobacteria bacterium UBA9273]HBL62078.1 hypothetical protein [Cyanobacteria bacterium UBA8803]